MRLCATTIAVAVACVCSIATTPAGAVSVGQIDTFSGSLQGWSAGGGGPPSRQR